MTELDKKIDALLAKQGLSKDEPDKQTAKPAAKKRTKKAQTKKAPAKKKSKKRPAKVPKSVNGVNPEQFAHKFIQNQCQAVKAYKELRPDLADSTARAEAYKALRSPAVQSVLLPLLEALMEKEEAQSEWVIKRWFEQADASPLDYFHIDERGRLGALDLSQMTPALRRNLRSIQVTDTAHGQSVKVTVVDQQKAVELLAKSLGMLVTNIDPDTEDRIGDLLERGVKRIQQRMDADAWRSAVIEGEFTDVG